MCIETHLPTAFEWHINFFAVVFYISKTQRRFALSHIWGVKTSTKEITKKARNREEWGNVCKNRWWKNSLAKRQRRGGKERRVCRTIPFLTNTQRKPNDSDSFKLTDRQNRVEKWMFHYVPIAWILPRFNICSIKYIQ